MMDQHCEVCLLRLISLSRTDCQRDHIIDFVQYVAVWRGRWLQHGVMGCTRTFVPPLHQDPVCAPCSPQHLSPDVIAPLFSYRATLPNFLMPNMYGYEKLMAIKIWQPDERRYHYGLIRGATRYAVREIKLLKEVVPGMSVGELAKMMGLIVGQRAKEVACAVFIVYRFSHILPSCDRTTVSIPCGYTAGIRSQPRNGMPSSRRPTRRTSNCRSS